ncbi:MAG: hypothetical protein WC516_00475 [Patescibacteria group bacterium]
MTSIKNQQGIILILTLIVMALLFAIAISFAVFIISDIRQARAIDDSLVAYYGADSGMERTLFLFRRLDKELVGNFNGSYGTGNYNSDRVLGSDDASSTLGLGGATWSVASSTDYEYPIFRQRIQNGQSVKLYFLNRTSSTVKAIGISWYKGVYNGLTTTPKLGLTFTQLNGQDKDGAFIYYNDFDESLIEDSNSPTGQQCFSFKDLSVNASPLSYSPEYVVAFKCLGNDPHDFIDTLTVKAYDAPNCSSTSLNKQAISNITIRSDGFFGQARQEIVAHIPPRDPVSGLLGFVLFSEQDITKDQ